MPTQSTHESRPVMALFAAAGFALALGHAHSALAQGADPLAEPFPDVFELSSLLPSEGGDGSLGFVLTGPIAGGYAGYAVAAAGDVNADGWDDVVIGAPWPADGTGAVYLVFGRNQDESFPAEFDLSMLDGANGVTLTGGRPLATFLGAALSTACDLNGDGIDDLAIGGHVTEPGNHGSVYIMFGSRGPWPARRSLLGLDGSNGFMVVGEGTDRLGRAIAATGDVNGDGRNDLLLGARYADARGLDSPGEAYVIFGRSLGDTYPATVASQELDGRVGFTIEGATQVEHLGFAVGSAGDFNGDGLSDIVIGAQGGTVRSGHAYVLFGRPDGTGFPSHYDIGELRDGDGHLFIGEPGMGRLGRAVNSAGDVNNDGLGDVVLGAPNSQGPSGASSSGKAYIVFGDNTASLPTRMRLDASGLSGRGVRLRGAGEATLAGAAVTALGDLNGDGIDDVAIGAPARPSSQVLGRVFVVFGRSDGWPAEIDLLALDGTNGFRIEAERLNTEAGTSVGVADLNGDGRPDLVIGAPAADSGTLAAAGRAYVVYGRGCNVDLDGDGSLTVADFLLFQNLFNAGDPIADFDGDGVLTIFDFLAYQNAFDLGCP